jgi:hypothetical protein
MGIEQPQEQEIDRLAEHRDQEKQGSPEGNWEPTWGSVILVGKWHWLAGDIPPWVENSPLEMKGSAAESSAGMKRQSKSLTGSGKGHLHEGVERYLDRWVAWISRRRNGMSSRSSTRGGGISARKLTANLELGCESSWEQQWGLCCPCW